MFYKIVVNAVTGLRILLSIILMVAILWKEDAILLITVLYFLICLTDVTDGRLARKFSACTGFGAVLDVVADLFFIVTVSFSTALSYTFPIWMLGIYIGKFIEFCMTSSYIRKNSKSDQILIFDRLGRRIAVLFYLLPYASIPLTNILTYNSALVAMNLLCTLITAGAMISSAKRIMTCLRLSKIVNE